MEIRNFKKEDLSQVLELCREVRNHHIEIMNGYFTSQDDQMEQFGFVQSLESNKTVAMVAEENGIIFGYLLAERKYSPYLLEPKVMHISNFGVKADCRGKGIGSMLMQSFYKLCQDENIDEIKLGVFNKNVHALRFYEHHGFEPLEQRMYLKVKK